MAICRNGIGSLTPTEQKVLRLLAKGHSRLHMSGILGVTINTVETHITNIYKKYGVRNAVQAVLCGQELGDL